MPSSKSIKDKAHKPVMAKTAKTKPSKKPSSRIKK
jgi:hypothetical protein